MGVIKGRVVMLLYVVTQVRKCSLQYGWVMDTEMSMVAN